MFSTYNSKSLSVTEILVCEDGEEDEPNFRSESPILPRWKAVVLEQKQFLAARTIQRFVRGWLVRRRFSRSNASAIVVQKIWRGFVARRDLILMVENDLQDSLMAFYNKMATLIQKTYRGWHSRKSIFDLTKLKKTQCTLAEDLIYSMLKVLHSAKREGMIPGIYSLRNVKCLDTSVALYNTFGYRFYNAQACYKSLQNAGVVASERINFQNSAWYTAAPFPGFDDSGMCRPSTSIYIPPKKPEKDLLDIVQAFMAGNRAMKMGQSRIIYSKNATQLVNAEKMSSTWANFTRQLVKSMKKWHDPEGHYVIPKKPQIPLTGSLCSFLETAKEIVEDALEALDAGV